MKVVSDQILLLSRRLEHHLPADSRTAVENNTGYCLQCNGIVSVADHCLPCCSRPSHRDAVSGTQKIEALEDLPPQTEHSCDVASIGCEILVIGMQVSCRKRAVRSIRGVGTTQRTDECR